MTYPGHKPITTLVEPIWCKQPVESVRDYYYFTEYLKMAPKSPGDPRLTTWEKGKPTSRNYTSLALTVGVSTSAIAVLAKPMQWQIRVQAYDRHINELHIKALEKLDRQEAELWAKKQIDFRKEKLKTAEALHTKAMEMLAKAPVFNPKQSIVDYANALKIALQLQAEALDQVQNQKIDITQSVSYTTQDKQDALMLWRKQNNLLTDNNETESDIN